MAKNPVTESAYTFADAIDMLQVYKVIIRRIFDEGCLELLINCLAGFGIKFCEKAGLQRDLYYKCSSYSWGNGCTHQPAPKVNHHFSNCLLYPTTFAEITVFRYYF